MGILSVFTLSFFFIACSLSYPLDMNSKSCSSGLGYSSNSVSPSLISLPGKTYVGENGILNVEFDDSVNEESITVNNMTVLKTEPNESAIVRINDSFSSITVSSTDKVSYVASADGCLGNHSSDTKRKETCFVYRKNGYAYSSSTSMDDAIRLSGDNPNFVNSPITIINPKNPGWPTFPIKNKHYSGYLKWNDGNQDYPLVGACVRLSYKQEFNVLPGIVFTYTDDTGFFDIEFDSRYEDPQSLSVLLDGKDVEVKEVDNENMDVQRLGFKTRSSDYLFPLNPNGTTFENGRTFVFSDIGTSGFISDFGSAIQVFESLFYYSRYAKSQKDGNRIKKCVVYYPCKRNFSKLAEGEFEKMEVAFYTGDSEIAVQGNQENDDGLKTYQSWDLLGHEYGHHVGLCLRFCVGVGAYSHSSFKDNIQSLLDSTDENIDKMSRQEKINLGLDLTWSESWPTYWAEIAQQSFPDEVKANYGNQRGNKIRGTIIGNRIYEASNLKKSNYFSIEHGEKFREKKNAFYRPGGEAYEEGIIRFLYEMNRAVGKYRQNEIPNTDYLWDAIRDCGSSFYLEKGYQDHMTFSDLHEYIYNEIQHSGNFEGISMPQLLTLLENYWLSPVKIKASISQGKLNLVWRIPGYSKIKNLDCRNYIVYYDSNWKEVDKKRISNITAKNISNEFQHTELSVSLDSNFFVDEPDGYVHVGLGLSPHFYCSDYASHYTGPYVRPLWEGVNFSMDSLAGINLDTDW